LGAIAGVYGSSENARRYVENLLLALSHRGTDTSIRGTEEDGAGWAIGCSSNEDLETHFLESDGLTLSLEGSFFRRQNPVKFAHRHLAKCTSREAVSDLMSEPGEYAAVGHIRGRMFAFRDPNGLKPLYYAERRNLAAFASERKALWAMGLRDVKRIPPGHLLSISKRGIRRTPIFRFKKSQERPMTFEEARSYLTCHLKRSVRRITRTIDKAAVAFSGGLDSAVTATLA
jgi:asparagine synthetase B (glutamine-hydrolysing)